MVEEIDLTTNGYKLLLENSRCLIKGVLESVEIYLFKDTNHCEKEVLIDNLQVSINELKYWIEVLEQHGVE